MALRTFRSNPSIGGFGSETTGGFHHNQYSRSLSDDDDDRLCDRRRDPHDEEASAATASSSAGGPPPPSSSSSPPAPSAAAQRRCRPETAATPVVAAADDAFAQIVKELVDNAVDACHAAARKAGGGGDDDVLRRVRVVFESVPSPSSSSSSQGAAAAAAAGEVLRVTVSDNGIGMLNMADCVSAFHTSKATATPTPPSPSSSCKSKRSGRGRRGGKSSRSSSSEGDEEGGNSSEPPPQASSSSQQQSYTAGRYGVGLTLCLLHAQRLVPDSCASIASATADRPSWERCRFVVDADRDVVRCVSREELPKKRTTRTGGMGESGTSVSLLVPGGPAARRAWPRLAEYFARFHLSMSMTTTTTTTANGGRGGRSGPSPCPTRCSLEVLAPMLAPAPLFVRPPRETMTIDHDDGGGATDSDADDAAGGSGGKVGSKGGAIDGGGGRVATATSGGEGIAAMDVAGDGGSGDGDGGLSGDVRRRDRGRVGGGPDGGDGGGGGDDDAADADWWTDGMVPEEDSAVLVGSFGASASLPHVDGGGTAAAMDSTRCASDDEGGGGACGERPRHGSAHPGDDDDSAGPGSRKIQPRDTDQRGAVLSHEGQGHNSDSGPWGADLCGKSTHRGGDASRVRERRSILRAAEAYLRRPIELKNVACSVQPIRRPGLGVDGAAECDGLFEPDGGVSTRVRQKRRRRDGSGSRLPSRGAPMPDATPMLEVNVIAYGPDPDCDDDAAAEQCYGGQEGGDVDDRYGEYNAANPGISSSSAKASAVHSSSAQTAKLMLVRMVNRIPLLDGAEAQACGMVRGIASKHGTWNSFGLDVSMTTPPTQSSNGVLNSGVLSRTRRGKRGGDYRDGTIPEEDASLQLHIPMFTVNDSIQVAPFFQSNTHSLFQGPNADDDIDSDDGQDSIFRELQEECQSDREDEESTGRSRRTMRQRLLPAGLRIGNLLIVTHIHAKPSALPLPTLSKGRLPMGDTALDTALECGLLSCLRSLQRTNPNLLLTAHQLKQTERDSRHVPAVAASCASIICNSRDDDFRARMGGKITKWNLNDWKLEDSNLTVMLPTSSSPHSVIPESCQLAIRDAASEATDFNVSSLGPLLEERLRLVLSTSSKEQKRRGGRGRCNSTASSDDGHCGDSYCGSLASEDERKGESNECNDGDKNSTCSGDDSDYDSMGMDETEPSEIPAADRHDADDSRDYGSSDPAAQDGSQVFGETSSTRVDDCFGDDDEWW